MTNLARVSPSRLLARVLEQPELCSIVQRLEPGVLVKLVEHVGLEDAGEIVQLATSEQLERIFDEDLWQKSGGGEGETFDAERFALWLAVLLDSGEAAALQKIAEMDEDLLALGLAHEILVIDIDAMASEMAEDPGSDDNEQLEKALESSLSEELEEFRIIAKDPRSWDPILALLVGLDRDHHALLRRLLERCAAMTTDDVDRNGGLYEALTSGEMLASDVASDRELRREREGFVAPTDAASFLRLARSTPLEEILASRAVDPLTKAHFRAAPVTPRRAPDLTPEVHAFVAELTAAGVLEESPGPAVPRLGAATRTSRVERALTALAEADPKALDAQRNELAYLVNAILGVAGGEGRAMRAIEALEIVSALCDLGLARQLAESDDTDARLVGTVRDEGLVKAFRVGWKLTGDEQWTPDGLRATGDRAKAEGASHVPGAARADKPARRARRRGS